MKEYFIGTMSGTSLDNVDIVISNFKKKKMFLKLYESKLSDNIRSKINIIRKQKVVSLIDLVQLDKKITTEHAKSILNALKIWKIKKSQIYAIGFHEQTIWYNSNNSVCYLGLGDSCLLAKLIEIPVVGNIRSSDIAYGGLGAPLSPLIHKYLFGKANKKIICLNIGGISNITVLHGTNIIAGYDTGPGNCLIDEFIQENLHKPFDLHGRIARNGKIQHDFLRFLLSHKYFQKKYPKATGREMFNTSYFKNWTKNLLAKDVLATLIELTALTISNEINKFKSTQEIIISGGGSYNLFLLERLKKNISQKIQIKTSDFYNINPKIVEGLLFALLAKYRLLKKKVDLRNVTGATTPTLLGGLFLPSYE